MKCIVAVDQAWGIGCENGLLYSIPEDMAFFRKTTLNKAVVMGRRTLESLPKARPLKNRLNIVMSRDRSLQIAGAITCCSLQDLGIALSICDSDDVYVMGGYAVYSLLLDFCGQALVTKIQGQRKADRFFPDIDRDNNWTLSEQSDVRSHNGLCYSFCVYTNKQAKELPAPGSHVHPTALTAFFERASAPVLLPCLEVDSEKGKNYLTKLAPLLQAFFTPLRTGVNSIGIEEYRASYSDSMDFYRYLLLKDQIADERSIQELYASCFSQTALDQSCQLDLPKEMAGEFIQKITECASVETVRKEYGAWIRQPGRRSE